MGCLIGGVELNPPCRQIHGASAIASIPASSSNSDCSAAAVVSFSPTVHAASRVPHAFTATDLLKMWSTSFRKLTRSLAGTGLSPEAWFQGWKPPALEASDAQMPRGKEGEKSPWDGL